MSDSAAKLVPVLDGSNYNAWYKAMQAYLMAQSLWGYANGDLTRPANNHKEWDRQNSIAIGNMVLHVKESIQQDVINKGTAAEVWICLRETYGTPCYAPCLILVRVYLLYLYSALYCTTGPLIRAYRTSVELIRDLDT